MACFRLVYLRDLRTVMYILSRLYMLENFWRKILPLFFFHCFFFSVRFGYIIVCCVEVIKATVKIVGSVPGTKNEEDQRNWDLGERFRWLQTFTAQVLILASISNVVFLEFKFPGEQRGESGRWNSFKELNCFSCFEFVVCRAVIFLLPLFGVYFWFFWNEFCNATIA